MTEIQLYMVGGAVRDGLMGVPTHDIDFSVVGPNSFAEMVVELEALGFRLWELRPEHLTVRAHVPAEFTFAGKAYPHLSADFVLARREGEYSDGRRPDSVEVGDLHSDLARRDYTVNALAIDKDGNLIDLFNGVEDLKWKRLVAVGSAKQKFTEDALRAVRALRFALTKGFTLDDDIVSALNSFWLPDLVAQISRERRQDELDKMFKFDTLGTLDSLYSITPRLRKAIMGDFRLTTTTKKVKR